MSRIHVLEQWAVAGIVNHNPAFLRFALESGLPKNHILYFGHPTFQAVGLLEYSVNHNFPTGLQMLITGSYVNTRRALEEGCSQVNETCINMILHNAIRRQRGCTECLFTLLDKSFIVVANRFVRSRGFNYHDNNLAVPASYLKALRGRAGQTSLHVSAIFSSLSINGGFIG